jgi:hypothetical protein
MLLSGLYVRTAQSHEAYVTELIHFDVLLLEFRAQVHNVLLLL